MSKRALKFEAMAARTSEAIGEMLKALEAEFREADADPAEVVQALMAGALSRAISFHLEASLLCKMPVEEALRSLEAQIEDYCRQTVAAHQAAIVEQRVGQTLQ